MISLRLRQLFILVWFATFCVQASAEEIMGADNLPIQRFQKIQRDPNWIFKVRLLPILSGLASSGMAGRLDHAFGFDFEKYITKESSMTFALGHRRLSLGVDGPDSSGITDISFIEETQVGGYYTYYQSPFFDRRRAYVRLGLYFIMANLTQPGFGSGDARRYTNLALRDFGARAALEYGWSMKLGDNKMFEFGLGFSIYLNNPYSSDRGVGLKGSSLLVRNVLGGVSDFYPTLNASFGFVFF